MGAQTEIDAFRIAFNRKAAGPCHHRRQRLGARLDVGTYGSSWSADLALRAERLERPAWSALASGLGPDWRETLAEAEVRRRVGRPHTRHVAFGAGVQQRWASGPDLTDGSVTVGSVSAALEGSWVPEAAARVAFGPSGVGGYASGGVRLRGFPASLWLRGYARRTLPEERPDLVFWVARGYTGLASTDTPLLLEGVPVPSDHAGARADFSLWRQLPEPTFSGFDRFMSLNVSAGVDARRGETVLLPQFTLAPEAVAVGGPVQAVAASGAVADVEMSASWKRSQRINDGPPRVFTRVTAWARAALPLAGGGAFRAAREREPTLRAGLSAEHSPDGLLRLDGRLEWRAATRWIGWPEPHVPAALLLDLGLSRSFADDHFEVTLSGRNVLGAPEQTHPLGATLDGRLFVRLEARF